VISVAGTGCRPPVLLVRHPPRAATSRLRAARPVRHRTAQLLPRPAV